MKFRSCLLAGVCLAGFLGAPAFERIALASSPAGDGSFVVAQAAEGEGQQQGGFFNRLFNRSSEGGRPVFLQQPQTAPTYSPNIKPHGSYGAQGIVRAGKGMSDTEQWALFEREVEARTQRALAAGEAAAAESTKALALARRASEREAIRGDSSGEGKKMVYDPTRVWRFDNKNQPKGQPPAATTDEPVEEAPSSIYNRRTP